ncbi:MAG: hypothetical protein ACO1RX_04665 [Candidatus Sericytochromatia bacterium]
MSETPVYFVLAQLNSLMTGSLRLSLAFALLGAVSLAWGGGRQQREALRLGRYFWGWTAASGGVGLGAVLLEKALLPYQNVFVNQGVVLALLLVPISCGLLWAALRWQGWRTQMGLAVVAGGGLWLACWAPSFSRSDKTGVTLLMALPVAISLAHFGLLLAGASTPVLRQRLHLMWGLSQVPIGALYFFWLSPQLQGIPQAGEFYPFINLYDWFLLIFVILYLGNLYIDFWLNQPNQETSSLALSWNYGVVVVGLLCLWLNTNVFDTLAL